MPRLEMPVRRLQKPLILVLLWAFSVPLCLSQTAGRVDNIQPNVLALVSGVLQSHHHGLQKVEMDTHDLISNYEEFRAHLLLYRAHFRFHLEGNSLSVTMEDLQSPANGTWNRSLVPANAAEAKLIAKIVNQLIAANQQLAKSPVPPGAAPSANPDTHRPVVSSSTTASDSGHELRIQPSGLRATPRLEQAKPIVFDPSAVFLAPLLKDPGSLAVPRGCAPYVRTDCGDLSITRETWFLTFDITRRALSFRPISAMAYPW